MRRVLAPLLLLWSLQPALLAERLPNDGRFQPFASREENWIADIDYLQDELPRRHPNLFFQRSQQQFLADLQNLRQDIPTLSDGAALIRLQQIVAALGDAHTEVDWRPAVTEYYPFRMQWFEDGLFVTRTTAEHPEACGARITAIGGRPIDEVMELIETVISHDNEYWVRFRSPQFIQGVEILSTLGIVPSNGVTDFTFARPGGGEFSVTVHPISQSDAQRSIWLEDPVTSDTPLYRIAPSLYYWDRWLPDQRTLYIKYNLCANMASESFSQFVSRVFVTVDRELPEKIIVDLRNNPGGSDSVIGPLFDAIQKRSWIDSPDRLYVVIGNQTFSSAVINTLYFRIATRARLVGEPTGGNANAYGEVKSFVLPRRGITVFHSTKYFQFDLEHPGAVVPDTVISLDSYAYFASRDPVLELIWNEGRNAKGFEGSNATRRRPTSFPRPRSCAQ